MQSHLQLLHLFYVSVIIQIRAESDTVKMITIRCPIQNHRSQTERILLISISTYLTVKAKAFESHKTFF